MKFKGNGLNLIVVIGLFMIATIAITSMGTRENQVGQVVSGRGDFIYPTCYDSDGGGSGKIFTKGYVTYTYGSLSSIPNDKITQNDYCTGNYIHEAYCYRELDDSVAGGRIIWKVGWYTIGCPHPCVNGACQ
jgi:hypothetical protein